MQHRVYDAEPVKVGMRNSSELARVTTKAASAQTFYIIQLLADRGRTDDACRAYAYFRWVDDWLDAETRGRSECRRFVARQQALIERCYVGNPPARVGHEEAILVDLIRNNPDRRSPLAAYILNMMAVMSFDAARRGRLISQSELDAYQRSLAVAVTEVMHYFIGRDQPAPHTSERYLVVTAAHIAHMLRDTREDIRAGYFNIPSEVLCAHGISPLDVESAPYKAWVRTRVQQARRYFRAGKRHLARVRNLRCRLAAYAYTSRFETVLDRIEDDGFLLRADYAARKTLRADLRTAGSILVSSLGIDALAPAHRTAPQDKHTGRP